MAAWIAEIEAIFAMEIATLGTLVISLGGVAGASLLFAVGVSAFKRLKGR